MLTTTFGLFFMRYCFKPVLASSTIPSTTGYFLRCESYDWYCCSLAELRPAIVIGIFCYTRAFEIMRPKFPYPPKIKARLAIRFTELLLISNLNICLKYYKRIPMETGKASTQYRYDKFNVTIAPINETKLQITVVDPIDRMEFSDK